MGQHGIAGPWETRERVMVALTGAPGNDHIVRHAARMARRSHGDLVGVHVVSDDGLRREMPELLARHRQLLEELGGTYHAVAGTDVPATLVAFASAQRVTQLVLGTSRRSRWTELTHGSVINPCTCHRARAPGHRRARDLVRRRDICIVLHPPPAPDPAALEPCPRAARWSPQSGRSSFSASISSRRIGPSRSRVARTRSSLVAFLTLASVLAVVVEQAAQRRVEALRRATKPTS